MITYSKILDSVKDCQGGAITFIVHSDFISISEDLIFSIGESLKSEYKIEHQLLDVTGIEEKTIIFIKHDKSVDFTKLTGNPNVILIVSKNYNDTSNTEIFGQKVAFVSDAVFLLKNKKLKVLRSSRLEKEDVRTIDITKIVRKFKLKNIQNESKGN
jgi:hypothetical protein